MVGDRGTHNRNLTCLEASRIFDERETAFAGPGDSTDAQGRASRAAGGSDCSDGRAIRVGCPDALHLPGGSLTQRIILPDGRRMPNDDDRAEFHGLSPGMVHLELSELLTKRLSCRSIWSICAVLTTSSEACASESQTQVLFV